MTRDPLHRAAIGAVIAQFVCIAIIGALLFSASHEVKQAPGGNAAYNARYRF